MEREPKPSILNHQHNELVIYSNPKDIISIVQAIVTARQISTNGASNKIGSWIEPCTVLEEGRFVHCPFRDLTAQTICKHPEGPPIPQDGKLECPAQKGPIRHIEHLTNT